jgi:hypothetical protein
MTLEQIRDRDALARKIVLAYQTGDMDRGKCLDGLRKLGWPLKKSTDILDAVDNNVLKVRP